MTQGLVQWAKAMVAGCKRVEVESGRQRSSGMAVRWSLEDRGKDHEEREKSGRKLLAQLVLEGTNGSSSSLLLLLTPLCT